MSDPYDTPVERNLAARIAELEAESKRMQDAPDMDRRLWQARAEQAEAERDELQEMLRLAWDDYVCEGIGAPAPSIDDWLADLRRRVGDGA